MDTNFSQSVISLLRASALFDEQFTGALSAVHGVSLREIMLMQYVRNSTGSKLSRIDLARRLNVSASTVTRMTRPLEKIGLISRESDARDARLSYVTLTPAGVELLSFAEITLEQISKDYLFQKLSEKELTQLEAILRKLLAGHPGSIA